MWTQWLRAFFRKGSSGFQDIRVWDLGLRGQDFRDFALEGLKYEVSSSLNHCTEFAKSGRQP